MRAKFYFEYVPNSLSNYIG